MTLTQQQFDKLSPQQQEAFLADEGEVLPFSTTNQPGADISPVSPPTDVSGCVTGCVDSVDRPLECVCPSPEVDATQVANLSPRGEAEGNVVVGNLATQLLETQPVDKFIEGKDGNYINEKGERCHTGRLGIEQAYDPALYIQQPDMPDGFDIADPVELLFLLDDDIASGKTILHKWQVQFMLDFARSEHCKDTPFYAAVRAANGSGKDKYIVAACVVWLCMRYSLARGVVTNGSGTQLDNQTEAYIRFLCQRANVKWAGGKELIWKCNYRYYECIPTQSPVVLFATDEPNKAEGYHPLKSGGRMAIFASEAKAIPDTIFTALTRCTGFTHRVDVSSPGLPAGYFYDTCMGALKRKELTSVVLLPAGTVIEYHITAFDCPHITPNEIKNFASKLPAGENDPVYKSGILAEFTTTDEMVVIPTAFVHYAMHKAARELQWVKEPFNKAGLDLSDGGAETVLVVRNGNKHLATIPFKFDDTQDTIMFLEHQFEEWQLTDKNAFIFADCCGIGKPMIDALRRRGWSNMRYVDSRHKAVEPKVYFNRGTELFFNVRKLLQNKEIIALYDKQLMQQLCTRYYKLRGGTINQLLTKQEQRSRGYPSPDRADAFNLAFWDFKSTRVVENYSEVAPEDPDWLSKTQNKVPGDFSLKQWANGKAESLVAFQRNLSNKQPVKHLQRELDRWMSTRINTDCK